MNYSHFIGGNSVDSAQSSPLKDFVKSHNGHTVISKVLIANNGEYGYMHTVTAHLLQVSLLLRKLDP